MKLLNALGAFLVWSVLTVDGLIITAIFLVLLALGGYIHSIWSAAPLWLFFVAVGIGTIAAILALIAIPLIMDFEDDDGSYPGS